MMTAPTRSSSRLPRRSEGRSDDDLSGGAGGALAAAAMMERVEGRERTRGRRGQLRPSRARAGTSHAQQALAAHARQTRRKNKTLHEKREPLERLRRQRERELGRRKEAGNGEQERTSPPTPRSHTRRAMRVESTSTVRTRWCARLLLARAAGASGGQLGLERLVEALQTSDLVLHLGDVLSLAHAADEEGGASQPRADEEEEARRGGGERARTETSSRRACSSGASSRWP